jgi:hypothetical protein
MAVFPFRGTRSPAYFGVEQRRRADTDDDDRHLAAHVGIQRPCLVSHLEFRASEYSIGLPSGTDRTAVTRLRGRWGWDWRHPSPSRGVGRAYRAGAGASTGNDDNE